MLKFAGTESLDGVWSFAFCPESEPEESQVWGTIGHGWGAVPGCFDTGPLLGKRGTGIYRRSFTGQGWLQLRFEGVGLRGRVWVDDTFLGALEAPFTPYEFTFDAGEKEREMTLTVAVSNLLDETPGSLFHEFYDFYGFGGIYRPVTLRRLAARDGNGFANVKVTPLEVAAGRFRIETEFRKPVQAALRLTLDGTLLAEVEARGTQCLWEGEVPGLAPWSPESPVLHTLTAEIPQDRAETTFGMRTLSWRHGELSLNGKPLKFMGMCRHDSHPEFGYAMPESLVVSDLQLIQEAGCHFLRGAHYMQSDFLLDCCDHMGLLVWEESCGWGNTAEQCGDPAFRARQREQTRRMVERHYNHPSVILWGVLNECDSTSQEGREILDQLFSLLHQADPSRPVTFASNRHEKDIALDLCDVIAFNSYPGWYDDPMVVDGVPRVKVRLAEQAAFLQAPEYGDKPWIISEIGASAMAGDHSGFRWSEEYQERILQEVLTFWEESTRCCGVAWWLFANVNTYLGAPMILLKPRGMNNKGLLTEYRLPKMAWRTLCRRLKGRPDF